jgi:thiol-disulfide isomerase/thioredoxin
MRVLSTLLLFNVMLLCSAAQPTRMNQAAPELQGEQWINSKPISLASRQGNVTVVHFWTFDCINCRHNLPSYQRWEEKLAGRNVVVIGVHTPELPQERVAANVAKKVAEYKINWPVLLDPEMKNWRSWKQEFWPAVYLIDKHGKVRYRWDGELNYGGMDGEKKMLELIEKLLSESD